MGTFKYGTEQLTAGKALQIARGESRGKLGRICRQKVRKSRSIVKRLANGTEAVYGINTGFGPLCDTMISAEDTSKLQYNIHPALFVVN